VPAAAVIPAPIAYIKVVAVKKLVVGFQSIEGFSGLPPYFFLGGLYWSFCSFFLGRGEIKECRGFWSWKSQRGGPTGVCRRCRRRACRSRGSNLTTRAFLSLLLPAVFALGVLLRLSRLLFRLIKSRLDVRSHSLLSVGILSS